MVEITNPDLDQAVEHFEEMVAALERYRETLVSRSKQHEANGRDPKTYAYVYNLNIKRLDMLHKELEGETYYLLKYLLDVTGPLASADEGVWI